MMRLSIIVRFLILFLVFSSLPSTTAAQDPNDWDAARFQMNREKLEEMLARFETTAQSEGYSREMRGRARQEAALIRTRLSEGDFQVGDRIALFVEGEPQLSDTFTVGTDRVLALPMIGDVSLAGVLRAELQPYLKGQIGNYIKNPVVRASSLIRVSVLGSVGRPGFYVVRSTELLTDVVMRAGGPGGDAQLTRIYVERSGDRIWQGEPLQDAIIEGRTIDQLSLRAGDRIYVPRKEDHGAVKILRNVGLVAGLAWTIIRVARFF
jgi:polysaccharide export outer membrane protein